MCFSGLFVIHCAMLYGLCVFVLLLCCVCALLRLTMNVLCVLFVSYCVVLYGMCLLCCCCVCVCVSLEVLMRFVCGLSCDVVCGVCVFVCGSCV